MWNYAIAKQKNKKQTINDLLDKRQNEEYFPVKSLSNILSACIKYV